MGVSTQSAAQQIGNISPPHRAALPVSTLTDRPIAQLLQLTMLTYSHNTRPSQGVGVSRRSPSFFPEFQTPFYKSESLSPPPDLSKPRPRSHPIGPKASKSQSNGALLVVRHNTSTLYEALWATEALGKSRSWDLTSFLSLALSLSVGLLSLCTRLSLLKSVCAPKESAGIKRMCVCVCVRVHVRSE